MAPNPEAVERRLKSKLRQAVADKLKLKSWNSVVLMEESALRHCLTSKALKLSEGQKRVIEEHLRHRNLRKDALQDILERGKLRAAMPGQWFTLLSAEQIYVD